MSHQFPAEFLWGAATSAYQIEGSPLADGAGASIWHRFVHTPERIRNGDTGDIACDHYRRWEADVALMQSLGLNAYRFSTAWSRVIPEGRGHVNARGLDFYQRLVDACLRHGIEPVATLYHWDLPAALEDRGGWLNRDSAQWFADYAQVMFRALGDRMRLWITVNEPWVVADAGYLHGLHAPGHANRFEAPVVSHNLLRAHALAVQAYRAEGGHRIGLSVNLEPKYPASERPEDVAAARRAHAYMNRQHLDPLFFGTYPSLMPGLFGDAWPSWPEEDFRLIRTPVDFIGVNYYTRAVVRDAPSAWPTRAAALHEPFSSYTEMDWEVYPQGLTDTLLWISKRYRGVPVYITENGAAFHDPPALSGRIDDPRRLAYLREHLLALYRAIQLGVDVRGYFVWSLLDNFEWSEGFSKRFGIVHVDYATLARTPKASARFYSRVIANGGATLFEDAY
ncbi:MAG: GH1 family beta-glucosidase [Gammaproteobacteria bacterium]